MKRLIYKLITYSRCLFCNYDKQKGTIIYNKVMRKVKKEK